MTETPTPTTPSREPRPRSLFWPIILISLGVLFLLNNLGIVAWTTWNLIWRFWPLVLVAVGADLLLGQRSTWGSILGGLVALVLLVSIAAGVFFADQLPFLARFSQEGTWQTAHVERTLSDLESAEVYIDWTSLPGHLYALDNQDYLIQGDLAYQGELIFDVKEQGTNGNVTLDTRSTGSWGGFTTSPAASWEIGLTPEIPLDITLDSGSGSCEFDLSGLLLEGLFLDSGSGSVSLALPSQQTFALKIDSGSGSLRIDVPEGSGMRVQLDSGSGSFNPGSDFHLVSGEKGEDSVWESDNYDTADFTIEMEIDQGSGSITFR